MMLSSYLSPSRHGVYYFRWPIPSSKEGKRSTVRISLRTRCPDRAGDLTRYLASCRRILRDNSTLAGLRQSEIGDKVQAYFLAAAGAVGGAVALGAAHDHSRAETDADAGALDGGDRRAHRRGGLGLTVYTGLGRLDVGAATEGGLGIVLLAMILDRITQALGTDSATGTPGLLETLRSFFSKRAPTTSPS